MLLGFTVGGSLVGLLLTMSVFRDIIESIFIDGLTEKEYLDYLRRTERRKYSARKMVRMYKERPRKFSSSIMTYRTVSFVFLAIHLILTAAIIVCTFLPIHFGARQALGLMAANLIIGGILETLYKRLSSQNAAGDKRIGGRSPSYTKNLFKQNDPRRSICVGGLYEITEDFTDDILCFLKLQFVLRQSAKRRSAQAEDRIPDSFPPWHC